MNLGTFLDNEIIGIVLALTFEDVLNTSKPLERDQVFHNKPTHKHQFKALTTN